MFPNPVLDLVLSNNLLNMTVPVVLHDLSSDHLPTTFELNIGSGVGIQNRQICCYDRANWTRNQFQVPDVISSKLDLSVELINN